MGIPSDDAFASCAAESPVWVNAGNEGRISSVRCRRFTSPAGRPRAIEIGDVTTIDADLLFARAWSCLAVAHPSGPACGYT